jgi:hypothetical protein
MDNTVYQKGDFIIIRVSRGFIVINKRKGFKTGHSHIKGFKTAKYVVDLVYHKRVPNHLPIYLLYSLIRVSDDNAYISKVSELIASKQAKTKVPYKCSA